VRTGSKESKSGNVSEIEKVLIHERFRFESGNFFFDIALIKLSKDLQLDGIIRRAINISQSNDALSGTDVYLAGWGENPNELVATTLHKVDLKVLPPLQCSLKWTREALILVLRNRQICALGKNNGDACAGDSGDLT
jgi:Trypsin